MAHSEQVRKLYKQGVKAEKEGRFQDALRFYKGAAKIDPGFRPAFNNLGAIYSRSRKPDLAIGFFQRARELGEDDIVLFNLGAEYYRLDRIKEAEKCLVGSLRQNSRLLRAHILLAYLYDKQQRFDRSDIYFANALKIDPSYRAAAIGFAVSLAERLEHEKSLQIINQFLKLKPTDSAFKSLRAGLLSKLDRREESLQAYTELAQTSEKFLNFTEHLNAARDESNAEYEQVFHGIADKISERNNRLKRRIKKRKEILHGSTSETESVGEKDQDLRDMIDLSFLHLFNGDKEKALRFLFQAQRIQEDNEQSQ